MCRPQAQYQDPGMTDRFGPCPPELRPHQDRQMSGDKRHRQITATVLSELMDMSRWRGRYRLERERFGGRALGGRANPASPSSTNSSSPCLPSLPSQSPPRYSALTTICAVIRPLSLCFPFPLPWKCHDGKDKVSLLVPGTLLS